MLQEEGYHPFVCEDQIMAYAPTRRNYHHKCLDGSVHSCAVVAEMTGTYWVVDDGETFWVSGSYDGWYCCPAGTKWADTMQPTPADCDAACVVVEEACTVNEDCCNIADDGYAFDQECSNLHCCRVGWSWSNAQGRCLEDPCNAVGGLRVPDSWVDDLFRTHPVTRQDQSCCAYNEEWEDIVVYS